MMMPVTSTSVRAKKVRSLEKMSLRRPGDQRP